MNELYIVTLTEDGEVVGFEIRNENDVYLSDHETLLEAIDAAKEMAAAATAFIEHIQLRVEPELQ